MKANTGKLLDYLHDACVSCVAIPSSCYWVNWIPCSEYLRKKIRTKSCVKSLDFKLTRKDLSWEWEFQHPCLFFRVFCRPIKYCNSLSGDVNLTACDRPKDLHFFFFCIEIHFGLQVSQNSFRVKFLNLVNLVPHVVHSVCYTLSISHIKVCLFKITYWVIIKSGVFYFSIWRHLACAHILHISFPWLPKINK